MTVLGWLAPTRETIDYWKAYGELVLIALALLWIASRVVRGGLGPTLKGVASSKVPV